MSETTAAEIVQAIQPITEGAAIGPDTPILSTGIVDSLSVAELAETLNTAFGVRLSVDELGFDNADTAEQLAKLVNDQRS
jgi:acyl carrier protein